MCGILGGINTEFTAAHLARLAHRGPDQSAFVVEDVPGYGTVELGQNRLNIVDREDVALPIRIGGATILFNGEIYNHPELRDELGGLGWSFATRTDTEVALAAYLQWGPDCLQRFNGMFSLVIWHDRRLFCARDRMGQKPLYCQQRGHRFAFASEVKAFDNLELVQEDTFDLFEFVFNEHTIYRDVFALKPGHYLIYDLDRGTWFTRAYWDIHHTAGDPITDAKQATDRFIELLEDAVRLRMRADVDVTLLLSGGIDSSLIAALSGVREAFTCQFDEFRTLVDEESYVRDLTERLGIDVSFIRPTREQFLADLPALAHHMEMPTGSLSVFPLYRLAKACRDGGYKVALSGEGADELFAGYARSAFLLGEGHAKSDERVAHYASMLGRYNGSELDRYCRMASRSGLMGAAQMKMLLSSYWDRRRSPLDNICYIESRIFLQPLLQMSDRMCMAHGVEVRCPFLDHRLVEFAFSLDDALRFQGGVGKWIVQEAARKVLPAGSRVLARTIKDGLPAPINLWLQGRHSFDRKYWNALMMAECIKHMVVAAPLVSKAQPHTLARADVQPARPPVTNPDAAEHPMALTWE